MLTEAQLRDIYLANTKQQFDANGNLLGTRTDFTGMMQDAYQLGRADHASEPGATPYPFPCTICGAELVKTADDEILPARTQRRNK